MTINYSFIKGNSDSVCIDFIISDYQWVSILMHETYWSSTYPIDLRITDRKDSFGEVSNDGNYLNFPLVIYED